MDRTVPLDPAALLRGDGASLKARRWVATLLTGPKTGSTVPLEGTVVVGSHESCAVRLEDGTVSRFHLELQARADGVHLKDLASTNGTFLQGARITTALIERETVVGVGASLLKLSFEDSELSTPASEAQSFGGVAGHSLAMRRLFATLERVAPTQSTVVLLGETGTGKGALARALHQASGRKDKPLVVIDCGAVAPNLIESDLFGHARGAFTGATSTREGAFVEADGGTVFLDEIGELPLELQPRLLRVLEENVVKRVGEDRARAVDVRVLAATHRELKAEVEAGRFREDLYYRLAVVQLRVPPLRERKDDIPLLVAHFLGQLGRPGFSLPTYLLGELLAHDWPGNVRELRNLVERALAGADLELAPRAAAGAAPTAGLERLPFKEAKEKLVDAFAREYLTSLLKDCGGNVSEVARKSGLARNYVHELLNKYGLKGS